MEKFSDLKKDFSNLEPEGHGRGIIMGVTCLLLLRPFYYILTDHFLYFFAHDCTSAIGYFQNTLVIVVSIFSRTYDLRV